jgi:HD superfamily phosphohydrolase
LCLSQLHALHALQVLSGQVCFAQQQQQTVAAVFDTRATLHERMYQHPTCKAAELMDADALLLAEPVINIRDKLEE